MVLLNELGDNIGSKKNRIRVGRGIGSGKGKTCGRGEKGQKSRTGVAIKGFEGGQMPIFRRLPKRGFNNIFRTVYDVVNIYQIQDMLDQGKISKNDEVDKDLLCSLGLIRSKNNMVKLLGVGDLSQSISVKLDSASKTAISSLDKAGGSFSSCSL